MIKKTNAIICFVNFVLNSFLHTLLLFGAPLGEYVLGGQHVVFPIEMRLASFILMFLWGYIAYIYLVQGGLTRRKNTKKTYVIIIATTIFMIFAVFSNAFLTTSIKERNLMTPLALVTSLSSIALLYLSKEDEAV